MRLGIDIGSTTIKCIVLDDNGQLVYSTYKRHFSHIKENLLETLKELQASSLNLTNLMVGMSGSAGMGLAESLNLDFVQEVYATKLRLNVISKRLIVSLNLMADAKILFLKDGLEVRMNGTCAGHRGFY